MILTILVALLALLAYRYYNILDIPKTLGPPTPSCNLLSPSLLAVEDFATYQEGVLLGSAASIIDLMEESPERMDPGKVVSIDARSGQPVVREVDIVGTPDGWAFHPHGIAYSERTTRLYAVNHAGTTRGGTRVEVFHVKEHHNEIEGADATLELHWIMAVGTGYLHNIALNSVVEASPEDIYFTHFKTFPVPAGGNAHPSSLADRLHTAINRLLDVLAYPGFTGVHHCRFDVTSRSTTMCRKVAGGFVGANGITISQDRSELLVVDPTQKEMRMFERDAESSDLVEVPARRLALPHSVDNVHLDESTGELWMGTLPLMYQQIQPPGDPKAGTFLVGYPQDDGQDGDGGGFAEEYDWKDEVVHDGSKLSQISACARLRDPVIGGEWNVCGSPRSKGILACKV